MTCGPGMKRAEAIARIGAMVAGRCFGRRCSRCADVAPVFGARLGCSPARCGRKVEIVDVEAAERRLQRREDLADCDPERLRLVAVDVEVDWTGCSP